MQIIFDEEKSPAENLQAFFIRAAESALAREGIDAALCELSFSFATQDEIQALNASYRGKDEQTDVLSFPMYGSIGEIREAVNNVKRRPAAPVLLGDVVVCEDVAARQAKDIGQSLERELLYLFIHSVLHLLGYDHDGDGDSGGEGRRAMREAEEDILRGFTDVRTVPMSGGADIRTVPMSGGMSG